jgi:glycosyltransferase involved in cell wall biosynthesis
VDINGGVGLPLLIASAWAGIPVVTHVRSYDSVTMQDSLQFSDVIVTVSNAVQEDVRRCEIRPEKVVTVYKGVDLRAFAPGVITRADGRGRLGIDGDEATIAFVARISPEKRYELFLSALARLRKSRPGLAALCVGEAFPSERGYYKRLKELVARLDLQDVVRWIGFTKDMATIYTAADVLVVCNPSEPLARCCIEACAMGLPVIAPRSGGSTEIVEHNKNGLLFEPDDVDSLVSTLETYLEDETLRANLQRGALAKAPQFSIDRHVTAMMNIFDGLLARELKEETVGSGVQWCAA